VIWATRVLGEHERRTCAECLKTLTTAGVGLSPLIQERCVMATRSGCIPRSQSIEKGRGSADRQARDARLWRGIAHRIRISNRFQRPPLHAYRSKLPRHCRKFWRCQGQDDPTERPHRSDRAIHSPVVHHWLQFDQARSNPTAVSGTHQSTQGLDLSRSRVLLGMHIAKISESMPRLRQRHRELHSRNARPQRCERVQSVHVRDQDSSRTA